MSDTYSTQSGTMTASRHVEGRSSSRSQKTAGLVLAWRATGIQTDDRAGLTKELTIGRSSSCEWCIPDSLLSRKHLTFQPRGDRALLFDLGSKNGTFLDGEQLGAHEPRMVEPGSVVRAGDCLFVVVDDLQALDLPDEESARTMAGRFHVAAIIKSLDIAARTGRHVLLDGESGSGKELAAEELHRLLCALGRADAFRVRNAAHFASGGDAKGDLFGISAGAFTDVKPRAGVLEEAAGGTVFLDEVHSYPLEVQRSLLRFVEDGVLHRLGEAGKGRKVDVRLVFATNVAVEQACDEGKLAHDLVARLHRVNLPPLRDRRADIPSLLEHVLRDHLDRDVAETMVESLGVKAIERLCLHDFRRGNVRELMDLAAVVGARVAVGELSADAFASALEAMIATSLGTEEEREVGETAHSHYERHREEIVAAYHEVDGKLVELEATLRARGIKCTRRWLAKYLAKWAVRPIRKRRR